MTDPTPTVTATSTPPAEPAKPAGILSRAKSNVGRTKPREDAEAWLFAQIRDEVAELLTGSPFDVDSYLQNAYREILKSKMLTEAARRSGPTVLGGIMLGATLQLPIGGPLGQFYLTPRNEGRGQDRRPVCVPMIGYKGFFELGYRSGTIRAFDYVIRREGDTWRQGASAERGKWFDLQLFADGEYDENDENGNRRLLTGVVALAHPIASDRPAWQFMSKATIDRRKPSNTNNTPWEGPHFEAMYVKTPHRELAKFLQLSIATAKAVEADEMISQWNRVTGAIDTLETAEGQHYTDSGEVIPPETDQNPGPAEPQQDRSASASVSPSEPPEAGDGRTAPSDSEGVDALDLPAHARSLGRAMTEFEYERYSAAGGA